MSIYEMNGYEDRSHYLEELALEYGLDFDSVYFLAQMLGEQDDFEGLIIAIENYLVVTY